MHVPHSLGSPALTFQPVAQDVHTKTGLVLLLPAPTRLLAQPTQALCTWLQVVAAAACENRSGPARPVKLLCGIIDKHSSHADINNPLQRCIRATPLAMCEKKVHCNLYVAMRPALWFQHTLQRVLFRFLPQAVWIRKVGSAVQFYTNSLESVSF
jgi:hypothetical protein